MRFILECFEFEIPDEVVLAEARRITEDRVFNELKVKQEIAQLTRAVSNTHVIDKRL